MVRYTLTDSKVEIDTGLIARTTRNIPLTKIQDVTVSASIPQRLLGFGDLLIDNASELVAPRCCTTSAVPAATPTCFCANSDAGIKN